MAALIYLPLRDRLLLRHAATLLEAFARDVFRNNTTDGIFLNPDDAELHQDCMASAAGLRFVARSRK